MNKVSNIPSLIHASAKIKSADLDATRMYDGKSSFKQLYKTIRDGDCYFCNICRTWKDKRQFYKKATTRCHHCDKQRKMNHRRTPRGFILNLISNAKRRCKDRVSKDNDSRKEFNLTVQDICDKLEDQKFRCKYSGIPMILKPLEDWRCSLERIDNNKGYTKNNVALICFEFQSGDRSFGAINPLFGSCQWSREKFQYFYKTRFGFEAPDF